MIGEDMTPAPSTQARPTTPAGDRTRQRILTAARDLFNQHGYASTTVRAIAAAAQADPALVVRYFGSKRELFLSATGPEFFADDVDLSTPRGIVGALVDALGPQLSRLLDLATVNGPAGVADPSVVAPFINEVVVAPVLAQLPDLAEPDRPTTGPDDGSSASGSARIQAVVGLVLGTLAMSNRMGAGDLAAMSRDQIVDLLTPAATALLDR